MSKNAIGKGREIELDEAGSAVRYKIRGQA